jgi:endonuclease/exonuclease/phosphatase family metal-dependent hydrolase
LALVVVFGGYVAYLFLASHRLPDNQVLTAVAVERAEPSAPRVGEAYRIVSYNVGFGAYSADYGFFMDGGTESRAFSKDAVYANLGGALGTVASIKPALILLQEIDIDGTRSYHVDESVVAVTQLDAAYQDGNLYYDFAQNYDSPYLMYPFSAPHGANKAGVMTFSTFPISSALRRSLPIETGLTQFLDLDRCYSVSRIPVEGGAELVLYNLHLSAYTSDGLIANEQLRLLLTDMQGEYGKGNWCIAGGDFNKDLLGDSSVYFGASDIQYTWAQPIPAEAFDGVDIRLIAPLDESAPVPSCRNADGPYHEGQYVLTIDGFLVSPNVDVTEANVVDTGFAYSDHNPVQMEFTLQGS